MLIMFILLFVFIEGREGHTNIPMKPIPSRQGGLLSASRWRADDGVIFQEVSQPVPLLDPRKVLFISLV